MRMESDEEGIRRYNYDSANLRATRRTSRATRMKRQMSIHSGELRELGGGITVLRGPVSSARGIGGTGRRRGSEGAAAASGRLGAEGESAISPAISVDSEGILGCGIGSGWAGCSATDSPIAAVGPAVVVVVSVVPVGDDIASEPEADPEVEDSANTGINSLFLIAQVGQTQSCDLSLVPWLPFVLGSKEPSSRHTISLDVSVRPWGNRQLLLLIKLLRLASRNS
jgi:hypothetical protein